MSKRRTRRSRRSVGSTTLEQKVRGSLVTGAVGLGMAAFAAPDAAAATFVVDNLNDSGAGSLRQALVDANNALGPDEITFDPDLNGTITLTTGELYINDSVDIQGPGPDVISVSGNNSSRVFYIYSEGGEIDVTISGLTIRDGAAEYGGGISLYNENLTLDNVVITENAVVAQEAGGTGGGLWADGSNLDLTITNSQITNNDSTGSGAGIYIEDTGGPVLIDNTVISGNDAGCCGGGIFFYDPDAAVTIRDTTISGNTAASVGGGIYLNETDGGPFTIERSTISGNTALAGAGMFLYIPEHPVNIVNSTISGNYASIGPGGGIYLYNAGAGFTLDFSTVVDNTAFAGGGVAIFNYVGDITNSVIANNTADIGPDLAGEFDVSYSLVESTADATINDNGNNIFNQDPMLDELADNGGPTWTHRPQIGSPVVDEADPATTLTTDQRGEPREYPILPDMGSVEVIGGVIQFEQTDYSAAENGGTVTLTVVRDIGTDPAEVQFATANGSATAGSDYTATTTTVTFAEDDLSETVNVPILDDSLEEGSEQFTATLTDPSGGASLGPANEAAVAITDVEPGVLAFSSATYSVNENAGTITITVNRTGGSTEAVSVMYSTTAGSATAGSDYTTTVGTLEFAPEQTSATFDVPILDDGDVEGNEDFTVTLSEPGGGASIGSPSTATVTIVDVEPGTLAFSSATYTVDEDAGTVTLTVNRTDGSTEAVSVDYTTTSGSATAGDDFTTTSDTLEFEAGQTSATFDVPILDDTLSEGNENFTVTLSNATNGATIGEPNPATVTITDVEAGTFAFSSATYTVDENAGTITITVNRTGGTTEAVSVDYATSNGGATAGSDYTTTNGTLEFAIGQTSATFDVPILDDSEVEGNETFTVTLSNATNGATIGEPNPATVTITDVEAGTLAFSSATYSVNESAGTVTITVNRTGGSTEPVSVNYATTNGSATAGSDYTTTNGTLEFAVGQTSATFDVPILDDTDVEGNETFTVTLSGATNGATIGEPNPATVTITDIEGGALAFSSGNYTVNESAGTVTLTVSRGAGSTEAVTVDYATSPGSAGAGSDYTTTNGTLELESGQTTATFDVPILDDSLVEGNESFTVTLSNATNDATIGTPNPATVTITDVEPGVLAFSSATYTVDEDAGSVTITVNRTGGSTEAVSVNYATTAGSAGAGSDYTTTNGTLNFGVGQTSATFDVPILDDTLVEGSESFTVTLSGATNGATIGSPNPATVTITDVEAGVLAFSSATYTVNEAAGSITITVNRTGGSTEAVAVNYATSNGGAMAGSDYTTTNGTLNFAVGQTSATFDVPILDDSDIEGNETFNVTLSDATNGATIGSPNPATVTITDAEPGTLAFSSATYTVNEDAGTITITVNRSGGSTEAVSVNYATTAGSATAGSDYTTTNGTLEFGVGQTSATFEVPILDDGDVEGNETFTVTLSGATNGATIGTPNPATVTITDVEAGVLAFSSATYTVNEDAGTITITVNRTGGSTEAVSVNYATTAGSATADSDYTTTNGTLNFAVGQTSATFDVPILEDAQVEGNENFTVTLSGATNGATIGTPNPATVTITDVEGGTLAFSSATYAVNENAGTITITVNRSGGSTEAVSVDYATTAGSATAGSDYTTTNGTLNFGVGQTSATFDVPILDDAQVEGNENFTVTLSGATNGATIGAPNPATVTITDVEAGTLAFSSATYSVNEDDGTITITVNRSGGSTEAVSVNYATTAGSASAGSDYTTANGTLNFGVGQTSATFDVSILDDTDTESDETFTVTLSGATNGAVIGAPNPATVTIEDVEAGDDSGTIQFSAANIVVSESDGTVTLTITRTGGSDGTVTASYSTADGSATAGSDYTPTSGIITFGPGDTTPQMITIPIIVDDQSEPAETFTVSLTGTDTGAPSTANITIAAHAGVGIPALGGFGKLLLILGAAMAGLFAAGRNRLWSMLLLFAFVAASAPPVMAQARPRSAKVAKKRAKEEKEGKIRGTVASIESAEGTMVITLVGGQSITLQTGKIRVVDQRGGKREKGAVSALTAGHQVVVKQTKNGVVIKILR